VAVTGESGSRRAILKWGSRWDVVGGDAETAARAIVRELERRGLAPRKSAEAGALRISAAQQAPWHRILFGALLQRAEWWIESAEGRLLIAADFRPFAAYSAFLVGLGLLFVGLFELGLRVAGDPQTATDGDIALGGLLLFGPLLILVPWTMRLLAPLGGRPVEDLWHRVLDAVREGNQGTIDRPGVGLALRHTAGLLAVFAVVIVELWRFWRLALGGPALGGLSPILLPVAALFGVALFVIVGSLGVRGLQIRMYGLLGGLTSSFAVAIALLAFPLPWWLAQEIGPARLAGQAGLFGAVGGSFSIALLALAAYLFLRLGLGFAESAWRLLRRLSEGSAEGILHAAVGSGARLMAFQAIFGAWWLLLAVLLGVAYGLGFAAALDAVRPAHPFSFAPIATISIDLIGRAIGRPGDPAIGAALRIAWLIPLSLGLVLLIVSLADFARRRRRACENLRQAALRPFPERAAIEARLGEIVRRARLGPVHLAFVETEAAAEAYRFGGLRPERFVTVAKDTVELLSPDRLAAVIAHEVAHHALGHLGRDAILRWLGRLTFVGDGFVRSLQDGFGHELRADARAIDLGADPGDLAAALKALRQRTAEGERKRQGTGHSALPHGGVPAAIEIPWRERLRLKWWVYRDAYRGADDLTLHYYHPVLDLRVKVFGQAAVEEGGI